MYKFYKTTDALGNQVVIDDTGLQELINQSMNTVQFIKAGNRTLIQLIELAQEYDATFLQDYMERDRDAEVIDLTLENGDEFTLDLDKKDTDSGRASSD